MICSKCGKPHIGDERCLYCGAERHAKVNGRVLSSVVKEEKETEYCPVCGVIIKDSDTRCPYCGFSFTEDSDQKANEEMRKGCKESIYTALSVLCIIIATVGMIIWVSFLLNIYYIGAEAFLVIDTVIIVVYLCSLLFIRFARRNGCKIKTRTIIVSINVILILVLIVSSFLIYNFYFDDKYLYNVCSVYRK